MIDISDGTRGAQFCPVEEITDLMKADGILPCETTTPPELTAEQAETGFYVPCYDLSVDGDHFVQRWEFEVNPESIRRSIRLYQKELTESDFIITKTYEARLFDEPDPYSFDRLQSEIAHRKELRRKINQLEEMIKEEE